MRPGASEEQAGDPDPGAAGAGPARRGATWTGQASRTVRAREEILQQAARRSRVGRREVDTEHLLLALTESDVVRTILDQFKVSLDDLRHQVHRATREA